MDLFLTWSSDGRSWNQPVFTGLTSFADPEGQVPPPTFSLKVRGREITIALTRTFAQSANHDDPRFKTLQRIHKFKLEDLYKDRDKDGLNDVEEESFYSYPGRADSDGDGLLDGKDKNPLAKPAKAEHNDDLLKVLAFSHAFLLKDILGPDHRLLVVEDTPGLRRAPELPTVPGLVLHLKAEQVRSMWKSTGGGFPRVRFASARVTQDGLSAVQSFKLMKGPDDEEQIIVSFDKRDDIWMVTGYEEQ
jgi:hypothetical protein